MAGAGTAGEKQVMAVQRQVKQEEALKKKKMRDTKLRKRKKSTKK
jgi:hypothetical protein